ncbi:uncharacterized protein LOC113465298 [Diaphorina citri]|uniref:Uncharacterized protein LOC113465298 n=1 Tax=Diaphorina citri TaxID=121845 RepID=A0A3Q0IUN6_DIACI|nr:uncharacterized protein LOC113465298 [Diaphorina citri]
MSVAVIGETILLKMSKFSAIGLESLFVISTFPTTCSSIPSLIVGIKSTSIVVLSPSITQQPLPPIPKRRAGKKTPSPGLTELRCHNRCGIDYESQELNVFLTNDEDTTRTALPEPPSDVYKNIIPTENDHDSFSDSFDSDSDGSSDLDSRETIHERSLPPPPTSAAQLNQNIYGFVKEAGRQVKKHWSRSSLGLNKIRKMSVGAIAQLPVVLPKSSEPDGKLSTQQPPSPISPTPLPPRGRRWSSFKTKFRTQSIFYLDDDFSSRETTPTKPSPLKTDTTPPPLPQKDFRRQSIALGSLANERDVRRQSIALRPSSPPPPPPTNRTVSTESSLNVSNKSDKILNSPTINPYYCTRAMMQMAAIEDSVPPTNKYLILLTILENHEQKTVEIVLSCDTESDKLEILC